MSSTKIFLFIVGIIGIVGSIGIIVTKKTIIGRPLAFEVKGKSAIVVGIISLLISLLLIVLSLVPNHLL